MRRRAEWMSPADVTILEFLYSARDTLDNPAIMSPAIIAENTGLSRKHAGNRCRHLADRDLVEKLDRGRYRLSDTGERLLDGRLDTADLEKE